MSPETDTEYQDATEMNAPHVCVPENVEPHPKQGKVGRFKARIAPGYHKACVAHKQSVKEKAQNQSGNVQPHGHHPKNANHHQCCGAFGNPHVRHKSSGSSCHII